MQKKIVAPLLSVSALLLGGSLQASEVKWADPLPNTAGVTAVAATPAVEATATTPAVAAKPAVAGVAATGGIGYEWSITMGNNDKAAITGSVGASSAYNLSNVAKGPEWAWTHTTDMVALDLKEDAEVTFMVMAQQGISDAALSKDTPPKLTYTTAGALLNPAISVFKGWEETGVETSTFNPIGKTSWTNELSYIGINADITNQKMTTYTVKLTKGKYTLMIGAANNYPSNGCKDTDTACYTGNHGYIAKITTGTASSGMKM